jgi:hypothetical protein
LALTSQSWQRSKRGSLLIGVSEETIINRCIVLIGHDGNEQDQLFLATIRSWKSPFYAVSGLLRRGRKREEGAQRLSVGDIESLFGWQMPSVVDDRILKGWTCGTGKNDGRVEEEGDVDGQ